MELGTELDGVGDRALDDSEVLESTRHERLELVNSSRNWKEAF